jgi:hypothetical protein
VYGKPRAAILHETFAEVSSRNQSVKYCRGAPACAPTFQGGNTGPPLQANYRLFATQPEKDLGGLTQEIGNRLEKGASFS